MNLYTSVKTSVVLEELNVISSDLPAEEQNIGFLTGSLKNDLRITT